MLISNRLAVAVLGTTFLLAGVFVSTAQGPPPAPQQYDAQNWTAPPGYAEAYPENGTANMVARQAYSTGYTQGQSDSSRRHKFDPYGAKFYKDVPSSPKGFERKAYVADYRQAFEKGYTRGFRIP